jgi:hypothetical protein
MQYPDKNPRSQGAGGHPKATHGVMIEYKSSVFRSIILLKAQL